MSPRVFPEVRRLVHHGDPMDKFNIVVLGDGFQQPELPIFDEYAALIAVRLLNKKPFKALADRINVWKVSTVSVDSGVTLPGAAKSTFYGIQGDWLGVGVNSYFGTPHMDRVRDTAALAVPEEAPGLRMMIVNHDAYGGRGSLEDHTVFVPLFRVDELGVPVGAVNRKRDFVEVTAHECGHAIAGLAEEYISCHVHDPTEYHANQQTPEDTAVKWKGLARPSELDAMGRFRAVHEVGDKMSKDDDPIVASAFKGKLGLYWGCMDIDPALPTKSPPAPGTCSAVDERGAPFHRPMARCRMRRLDDEFCKVCTHELKKIIIEKTK